MHQYEIIRMAREVGIDWHKHWDYDETNRLTQFAELVSAAEREACERVCGELANNTENSEQYRMAANWCRERIRARGNT